jgi:hypothetical protein
MLKALLAAATCLSTSLAFPQTPALPDSPITTFGVTVVDPSGLKGDLYLIRPGATSLPDFEKLTPAGTVYTSVLNIPPRHFTAGFPGITDRNEWFAIDYTGKFYISEPGKYRFLLVSDDGSRLYIDGKRIIDNDGIHAPKVGETAINLSGGIHRIRVSYFQGPRDQLALILAVLPPGGTWRAFSTNDYRPPRDPSDWRFGSPADLDRQPEKRTR